jgi:hypothetical protein
VKKLSLVLFWLVLALAACGGGESKEDKVAQVVETWAAATDPANCKKLATQSYVEQTQMIEGTDALSNCEFEVAEDPRQQSSTAEVESVEIEGTEATADVAFTGGAYDGQTLSIDLVERNGSWKLDEITGFARFEREKLVRAFQKVMLEGVSGALEPSLAACVAEQFGERSRPEFEAIVLGRSPLPIELATENC